MEIFDRGEQQSYLKNESGEVLTVEVKRFLEGETLTVKESQNRLLFQIKGSINLDSDMGGNTLLNEKEFIFIPSNKEIKIHSEVDSEIMLFRIGKQISLCQYFQLEEFRGCKASGSISDFEMSVMVCNGVIQNYLEQLKVYIDKGLTSQDFFNLKLDELLLSFKWFLTKEQLANLFSSQLSIDTSFSDYIIKNARKFHSVSELAKSMNYSVSGFDKKFKRVFGISGYKWMQQQKAKEILQAICTEQRTFKEIAYSFEFTSESYFYEFCKSQFGTTPGQLRKRSNSL